MKYLESSKEVMEAFLAGHKLQNSCYNDEKKELYLYLEESGYIAEEDGAGAKAHRVPICMRYDEKWWIVE